RRARLGEAREDVADGGGNGLVGVEADLAIGLAPDKADRQSSAEFTACCLVANAAVEAGPQHMQLGLAHGALEPEQEAIIEEGWMIDAICIADQRVGEAAEVDDGLAGQMAGRDLGAFIHRLPPSSTWPRSCGR